MASINDEAPEDTATTSDNNNQQACGTSDHLNATRVRYLSWGIFKLAYEESLGPWFSFLRPSAFMRYCKSFRFFFRFLKELWRIDPWHTLEYYAYTLWLACSPVLSLCLASLVICNVQLAFKAELKEQKDDIFDDIRLQALTWLCCGLMTHRTEHVMIELRAKIGGSLRAYFLPKLVRAHLEWNPDDLENTPEIFPYPSDFGDFIPGWDFLTETSDRLRHATVIISEIFALAFIISLLNEGFEAYFLYGLLLLFLFISFCSPINGAGGGGYTFWTKNVHYNRLMALFNIVFDHKYRFSLVKDGLIDYLIKEYDDASEVLGVVEADTWSVGWGLSPAWYWGVAQSWLVKDPMALCALFIPWATSRSIIGAMVIFQYAIYNVRDSIDVMKHAHAHSSLLILWKKAETLYRILDKKRKSTDGRNLLDHGIRKSGGVKITFGHASYKYPHSSDAAVDNVSLTIEPGQLIGITGSSGSGKTTLVKLLGGFMNPTEGEILIDGSSTSWCDLDQLRREIAFIGQSEAIYPLSLRENVLFGLANPYDYDLNDDEGLETAANLAGCLDFFKEYKDVILNPCSIPSYSFQQTPGRDAIEALEKEMGKSKGRHLSPGESQLVFAARAFMKAQYGNTKLIILDDPFGALDTMAGRAIFEEFQKIALEKGQTIIIVTNQLATLANADVILFMSKGKLEEQGTHDDLITFGGRYSTLYKAQSLGE